MKIHQLAMGARFIFEGEEYVKSGPMMASGKSGQRLIPKYAVLQLVGDTAEAPPSPKRTMLKRAAVIDAFGTFYATCEALVDERGRLELDAARTDFMQRIEQE